MVTYDNVISLGYNCSIANALIHTKNREFSLPFDWNFTSDIALCEYFENDFNNFFKLENLRRSRSSLNPSCEYIKNTKQEKIIYVHNGKYKYLKIDSNFYKQQYDKYQRRISRLLKLLNSNKNLLFIRLIDKNDEIKNLLKLENIIKNKYPNLNFKILLLSDYSRSLKLENDNIIIKYYKSKEWSNILFYIEKILLEFETVKYPKYYKNYND